MSLAIHLCLIETSKASVRNGPKMGLQACEDWYVERWERRHDSLIRWIGGPAFPNRTYVDQPAFGRE